MLRRPSHDDALITPTPALAGHAQRLLRELDDTGARFVLWDKRDGQPIELTEELFALLRSILIDLSQNRAVQVLPWSMELTTVQAAEFLNVSRPFVIKLIDEKKLPCRMVGTHRRIRLEDLMAFKADSERQAAAVREAITKDAEADRWGY